MWKAYKNSKENDEEDSGREEKQGEEKRQRMNPERLSSSFLLMNDRERQFTTWKDFLKGSLVWKKHV